MKNFNPKQILVETLEKRYQVESIRGKDVIALNSKAILYVRYSKNLSRTTYSESFGLELPSPSMRNMLMKISLLCVPVFLRQAK